MDGAESEAWTKVELVHQLALDDGSSFLTVLTRHKAGSGQALGRRPWVAGAVGEAVKEMLKKIWWWWGLNLNHNLGILIGLEFFSENVTKMGNGQGVGVRPFVVMSQI